MIKTLKSVYSGEVFENVEILPADELPSGCDYISSVCNEEDYEHYEVYKNCVDKMLYAYIEEDLPF